jgi:predicted DNA-binding ribbon-helix-helix protein
MEENKAKRASFSIEDEYVDLMRRLAKKRRMTMTALLRLYIDQDAEELGIAPIAALPKVAALNVATMMN